MSVLHGHLLDGVHPIRRKASLTLGDRTAEWAPDGEPGGSCALSQLKVSPRVAAATRFVSLPNDMQFACPDHPILDHLIQDHPIEGPVAWLERRVAMAVAGIAVAFTFVSGVYIYGLPLAAESIVRKIPLATEQALGREVEAVLDEEFWSSSQLAVDTQVEILAMFDELREGLSVSDDVRLSFRSSDFLGPNAFALPGGQIVMTDQMVELAESQDEIAAVLAHELGHVEHRHIMRHLIQNSVTAVLVSAITADAASLSVAVVGVPTVVAQAKYSRDFESEADGFAFEQLSRVGRSPEAFATLMERLAGDVDPFRLVPFLSSHPQTDERAERARQAAEDG